MATDRIASPTDLPRNSWGSTLKRTLNGFKDDKLNHWAAALTFYAVLSLFPALLVMVSLVGLLADPATVTKFLTDVIGSLGPSSAVDTFKEPIDSITSNQGAAGIMAIVGVARRPVVGLRLRQRVHGRVELDLRGRGGPAVLEAQADPAARHVRLRSRWSRSPRSRSWSPVRSPARSAARSGSPTRR